MIRFGDESCAERAAGGAVVKETGGGGWCGAAGGTSAALAVRSAISFEKDSVMSSLDILSSIKGVKRIAATVASTSAVASESNSATFLARSMCVGRNLL